MITRSRLALSLSFALSLSVAGLGGCAPAASSVHVRPAASAGVHPQPPVLYPTGVDRAIHAAALQAKEEDAVVRVVGPELGCSGALIDDDLVLTAHHCVVKRGPRGEFTREKVDPASVQIELGGGLFPWGTVGARAILAPPCGAGGGAGDIAIIVLQRKLVGISTLAPRLDKAPRMGERMDPVGFGRCALSPNGIQRVRRGTSDVIATTQETFVMDASICPGDSGGPVIAQGEIVGIVSESAMDGDDQTKNKTVLARIDVYRSVFAAARQVADGVDPSELPPLSCVP